MLLLLDLEKLCRQSTDDKKMFLKKIRRAEWAVSRAFQCFIQIFSLKFQLFHCKDIKDCSLVKAFVFLKDSRWNTFCKNVRWVWHCNWRNWTPIRILQCFFSSRTRRVFQLSLRALMLLFDIWHVVIGDFFLARVFLQLSAYKGFFILFRWNLNLFHYTTFDILFKSRLRFFLENLKNNRAEFEINLE